MSHLRSLFLLSLTGFSTANTFQERREVAVSRSNVFPREAFEVSKFAALGESYASGPSAGDRYDNTKCRRYKKAFGPQVAEDSRIQGPKPMHFDFIACSGSNLKQIYEDNPNAPEGKSKIAQAKQLKDNPEMVTLSIGGNDVGFVELLDRACSPSALF
jgi:hypothetical protein